MRAELALEIGTLYSFLLVLARVSGVFVLVPLPGLRSGPELARMALSLSLTLALFPVWPAPPSLAPGWGRMLGWILAEAAFGATVGLAVAFLAETLQLGAQVVGLQAGYSYASMIDPSSQADSSVLQVFTQLAGALLFFVLGLDHHVIRIFARSLEVVPPGGFVPTSASGEGILRLGSAMFSTGLRLALPIVALLLLVDVTLALMSKINAHLQLITMAFPAKMLVALAALGVLAALIPRLYGSVAARTLEALAGLLRN